MFKTQRELYQDSAWLQTKLTQRATKNRRICAIPEQNQNPRRQLEVRGEEVCGKKQMESVE